MVISVRKAMVAILAVSSLALTSCGHSALTADSKCSDFIKSDLQTQNEAARRIVGALHLPYVGESDAVLLTVVETACEMSPDATIRQQLPSR